MQKVNLVLSFPDVEEVGFHNYKLVTHKFMYSSYNYSYMKSLIPPNHIIFSFGPLSEKGYENMKEKIYELNLLGKYNIAFSPA